ncbi:MAG: hypothetical protein U0X74_01895 [Anaerolineales bacterium]
MTIEKPSPRFIIGSRHAGLSRLTSINAYSTILQKGILGEISDTQRKALIVISDCCETSWECWKTLTKLIEQNEDDKAIEILCQTDTSGQSYLEKNFIQKSISCLEIAKKEVSSILEKAQNLTDEQRHYVEMIDNNCQHEIDIWIEVSLYYS